MSNTTITDSVQQVLRRLEADESVLRANWCLPGEAARFMYLLTQIGQFKQVLEVGTSIGYSTLHFAWAAHQQGGHVTTIDASPERQGEARQHISEAGLTGNVTFLTGDAIEQITFLQQQGARFDLVFLDARKSEYSTYWQLADTMMGSGSVLIADNTQSHRKEMADFIQAITRSEAWETSDIDTPNGFLMARKR